MRDGCEHIPLFVFLDQNTSIRHIDSFQLQHLLISGFSVLRHGPVKVLHTAIFYLNGPHWDQEVPTSSYSKIKNPVGLRDPNSNVN